MEKGVRTKELSLCVKVCRVQAGVCVGCGRTLDQIAKWSKMTDEEKIQIMENLR